MQQKVPRDRIWLDEVEWSSHPWANHHSQKHCLWWLGVCHPETFAAAFLIAQSVGVRANNQRIAVSVRTSRVLEFVLMHSMERAVMINGVGRAKEHGDFIFRVAWSCVSLLYCVYLCGVYVWHIHVCVRVWTCAHRPQEMSGVCPVLSFFIHCIPYRQCLH